MKRPHQSIYYLQELHYRLAYAALGSLLLFSTTYTYKQALIFILLPQGLSHFVSAGLTEILFTYLQLCSLLSLGFGLVLVATQGYLFLRPGLYRYESRISLGLLVGGICFYACLYLFVFPSLVRLSWELFSEYAKDFSPIHLSFEPRLKDYLEHIKELNKILGLSFPCMVGLGILQSHTTKESWIGYRGIAYIAIFFIAALITPPDIVSQVLVGLPFLFFYETQIILWALYKAYKERLLIGPQFTGGQSIGKPIKAHKDALGKEKQGQG